MKLSEKQRRFTKMVGELIVWAFENDLELTLGEVYRPQRMAEIYAMEGIGIKGSKHCSRLAIDVNLFISGKYMTKTKDYRTLGEKWKELGGIWGGDFKRKDGNHFEL